MRKNKDKKDWKVKQPHWYKYYSSECVLCGAGDNMKRIRVYGEKPEKPEDRYIYEQFVCGYHFV